MEKEQRAVSDGTPDYERPSVKQDTRYHRRGKRKPAPEREKTIIILASIAALSLIAIAVSCSSYIKAGLVSRNHGEKQAKAPFEEKPGHTLPNPKTFILKGEWKATPRDT